MKSRLAVLVAVLMMLPVGAGAQGVDIDDLSRQASASQWMRVSGDGSLSPWGDYSDPRVTGPDVTTCFEPNLIGTTSYRTTPMINLDGLMWNNACFTKGSLADGAPSGPIPMDLMPNMSMFRNTYTFDGLTASDLAPSGSDVMSFTLDTPQNLLDPAYCEGATTELALGQKDGPFTWMPAAGIEDDYWGGASRISVLKIENCQLSSMDYVIGEGNTVMSYPGNMLAAIGDSSSGGSIITGMVRITDRLTEFRPTMFHTNQTGNFDSSIVGHVWPEGGMFYSWNDVVCVVNLTPPTTTSPTTTTTVAETTTTVAAATTQAESTTTTAAADDPSDEGGGIPFWVWILILIGVAIWFWRLLERFRSGGGTDEPVPPLGPEGPVDPGDPEDPESTPGLLPPHEREDPPPACDWALYLLTASGEQRIRGPKPGHHECCVYKVQVTSFVHELAEVIKERQDVAEEGRERASVGGTNILGQDVMAKTGVRSWPYGEQGAMHGLGDMSEWPIVGPTPGPWPDYWQEKQFEEQLDAAYSAVLHQDTQVHVTFTDGCGASKNEFRYDADSGGYIDGTFECTNENTDPTCPIEITAAAGVKVVGKGDLGYELDVVSHSDPDELPSKIKLTGVNAEFRMADADGHDHANDRDREIWEVKGHRHEDGKKTANRWHSTIENRAESHAGLMIPQAMWPTTDRVTALVKLHTRNEFSLFGDGNIKHGPKSQCCAHGSNCECAPEFHLAVGPGAQGTLTVDGIVRDIRNLDPTSTTQTIVWE